MYTAGEQVLLIVLGPYRANTFIYRVNDKRCSLLISVLVSNQHAMEVLTLGHKLVSVIKSQFCLNFF